MELKQKPASKERIELARKTYQTDDIEIDDDALVSPSHDENGQWVSAWVWVPDDNS